MNDLIRREDAIKALRCEYPTMPIFKGLREEWAIKTEGFRKAEEVIMSIPSADRPSAIDLSNVYSTAYKSGYEKGKADRPQGEWIPCSERLPEYRKTVLISTFWGVKTGFLDSTEAYGDFWEIIEDDATAALHSIYAWMPLPKPWKGVDDE